MDAPLAPSSAPQEVPLGFAPRLAPLVLPLNVRLHHRYWAVPQQRWARRPPYRGFSPDV
ncbi:hypothetical protein Mapa_015693 [Marchantia paleacea]|nr:hypothetical protein Mapa_015693 [Marchantia paleacea]